MLDIINDKTKEINDHLKTLYDFFPTFLMADGLFQIALKPLTAPDKSYFAWDITGRNLTLMAVEAVGYFLVVLVIEFVLSSPGLMTKLGFIINWSPDQGDEEPLDDDVESEKRRILSTLNGGIPSKASSINAAADNGHPVDNQSVDESNSLASSSNWGEDTVVLAGLRKVYKGTDGKPPNGM